MLRIQKISVGTLLALTCAPSAAQQMTDFDGDYVLVEPTQSPSLQSLRINRSYPMSEPISDEQLDNLLASLTNNWFDPYSPTSGFQLNTLEDTMLKLDEPGLDLVIDSIDVWMNNATTNAGINQSNSLNFSVDRNTELRDGNISGSERMLDSNPIRDHVASIAQNEGEYDIYDLSLEWQALRAGPVTVSMLSGMRAIEANIGKRVTANGSTSFETVNRFTAVPMVGSGLRWQINDAFSFSSSALTHPIETGDALLDINASTDLRISTNIGFSAGYRMTKSSFSVGSVDTEYDQEGLFARLKISF